jgi:hypothetical protein
VQGVFASTDDGSMPVSHICLVIQVYNRPSRTHPSSRHSSSGSSSAKPSPDFSLSQ